ncbi:MAG: OmpA family protein [Campylobacterota bacterium]|nr:OmpA family protein [Campylobacterota bacterium]
MFREKNSEGESNFWISYADLMAGLLFVFILLIGAIVSKSIILKSDLNEKKERLSQTEEDLLGKEGRLTKLTAELQKKEIQVQEKNSVLSSKNKELKKLSVEFEEQEQLVSKKDSMLSSQGKELNNKEKQLIFKDDEIEKLNKLLRAANTERDNLNGKIVIVQNLLDKSKITMKKSEKSLNDYQNRVLILSNQLTDVNKTLELKEEEMLHIMNALDEKETDYNRIVENLQNQKAKIKSLTGIKIKVIGALKKELGSKISIDPQSGSLRLSSNILFDKGSAQLKEESKTKLKEAFEEYIGALVTNPNIKPHLDKIVIEGHTDSDGGYLYNLDLSQKRAYAVMNYLLTLDFTREYNIKPLIIASGRSYLDAIKIDGTEDKDASRRIEIKFRLKNEDAMHEIEKVLDAQ